MGPITMGILHPSGLASNMAILRHISTVFFGSLVIASCALQVIGQQIPTADNAEARTGALVQSDLQIVSGDAIAITVFDTPELTGTYRVGNSGYIVFPLIGRVNVAGKSAAEIGSILREELISQGFLKDPQISVSFIDYLNHSVTVLGEVARPGSIPLTGAHSLWEVVGSAGGVTPAASDKVIIQNKRTSQTQEFKIDWSKPITGQANPIVEVGDTIQIEASGLIYVVGLVNRQGAIPIIRNDLHVSAVIAAASGFAVNAKASQTRIIRRMPDGGRLVSRVDVNAILKGKAPDVELRPNDILYVPYNLGRAALVRGTEAAVGVVTSLALIKAYQ